MGFYDIQRLGYRQYWSNTGSILVKESPIDFCHFCFPGNNQLKESEVPLKISVHSTPFVAVQFNSASYRKSLAENSPVGSTVFTVSASRPGSDAGTLKYSIVGGDVDSTFNINSNNGKVTLAKSLDYETVKSYKLIVRATFEFSGGGIPDVTAEVAGQVTVQDINDNSPRFLVYQSPTRITIESYTPSATEVMQVNTLKYLIMNIYKKKLVLFVCFFYLLVCLFVYFFWLVCFPFRLFPLCCSSYLSHKKLIFSVVSAIC